MATSTVPRGLGPAAAELAWLEAEQIAYSGAPLVSERLAVEGGLKVVAPLFEAGDAKD